YATGPASGAGLGGAHSELHVVRFYDLVHDGVHLDVVDVSVLVLEPPRVASGARDVQNFDVVQCRDVFPANCHAVADVDAVWVAHHHSPRMSIKGISRLSSKSGVASLCRGEPLPPRSFRCCPPERPPSICMVSAMISVL